MAKWLLWDVNYEELKLMVKHVLFCCLDILNMLLKCMFASVLLSLSFTLIP